jgi:hypothetical protein
MMLIGSLPGSPVWGQESANGRVVALADARSTHTATLVPDGRVLIIGGVDGEHGLASVEAIDPLAASVETLGSLATARLGHTATLLPDGRVLIAGGFTGGPADRTALADAELLDPLTGLTESVGPMRWARGAHAAAPLKDGRVLLVGGMGDKKHVLRAEVFNPVTKAFAKVAKPRAAHLAVTATTLLDGRVLVTGLSPGKKAKSAEAYDPARDKWSSVKGGGDNVGHSATLLSDGRVLLAAGSTSQVFDPSMSAFAPTESTTLRGTHTATLLPDGRVLIAGSTADEVLQIEAFDGTTGSFEPAGEMFIPRSGASATLLPDGRVLMAGGEFAGLTLHDVLTYDPATERILPLGFDPEAGLLAPEAVDPRSQADIRANHGAPEAFAIYYYDEAAADGTFVATSMERWTYYGDGVEYAFADQQVLAEDELGLEGDVPAEPVPYDPDQFSAYMSLDEVVAAAGVEDYLGGPVEDLVEGGELYFADRLIWGMKDGELRYIEALALEAEVVTEEAQ